MTMDASKTCILMLTTYALALMSSCTTDRTYGQEDIFLFIQQGNHKSLENLTRFNPELIKGAKDSSGFTPLMTACAANQSPCAKLLLKHGADPNQAGLASVGVFEDPINLAAACSDEKLLMLLLKNGAVAKEDLSPVYSAVRQQNLANLKWLLENGFSPNGRHSGNSPFLKAIDLKNHKMIDLFIKHNARLEGGLHYNRGMGHGWFITAYGTEDKKLIKNLLEHRRRSREFRILGDDQFAMWYAEKNGLKDVYDFLKMLRCRPRDPSEIVTLRSDYDKK